MHSIFESAKWFIQKNRASIERERLQWLCYYSQAWSFFMLSDRPLFVERFEARPQGPINHDLCMVCRDYEKVPISAFENVPDTYFTEDEKTLLNLVWDIYGGIESERLGCLVRCEQPWKDARRGLRPGQSCVREILAEDLRRHHPAS